MKLFESNDSVREIINEIIRIGVVHSIDPKRGTARVHFQDDDDIVSYDLHVLHRNTYQNKDYNMPDIGEDVLCIFLSSGMASGFVLGSIYAGNIELSESDPKYRTTLYKDGTRVRYDREKHELTIDIEGTNITANRDDVTVTTPNDVKVKVGNDVTIDADHDIKITASNDITITGTNKVTVNTLDATVNAGTAYVLNTPTATVNAPAITLNGEVTVTGTLTAAVDVIANDISLVHHTHPSGCGGTGEPN